MWRRLRKWSPFPFPGLAVLPGDLGDQHLLDRQVAQTIRARARASLQRKQDLAAIIHLCGASVGQAYVARGFRLTPRQRCGDHEVRSYLAKVNLMKQRFSRLAAR